MSKAPNYALMPDIKKASKAIAEAEKLLHAYDWGQKDWLVSDIERLLAQAQKALGK